MTGQPARAQPIWRMLLGYVAIATLTHACLFVLVGLVLLWATQDSDRERLERQYGALAGFSARTLAAIADPQERSIRLEQLGRELEQPLGLVEALPRRLDRRAEAQATLMSSGLYVDWQTETLYAVLPGETQLLVLGPLITTSGTGPWGLDEDLAYTIIWLLATALLFVPVIMLVLLPLRRDLARIHAFAMQLARSELEAPGRRVGTALLAPLMAVMESLRRRLRRQLETRQIIVYATAHELRTPIARVRFGLELLEDSADTADRNRIRHGIEQDLREFETLIDQVLQYGRLEARDLEANLSDISVPEWLEQLIERCRVLCPAGVTLGTGTRIASLVGDRKLLDMAVVNLLGNACRYARTRVVLSVMRVGREVLITVEDDGPGVPEVDSARIFDLFVRLDGSRDREIQGFGLGLSFVRLITELHDGHVKVERGPLGGALFTVALPDLQGVAS